MPQTKSSSLFSEAQALIPGGVNSPVRSFRAVGGQPPFIQRGLGSHIWDVDGNEYIDYVGSWGPLILGHAHPAVVQAVQEAAARGTSFGAPTEGEVELARLINQAVPSMELLRLVSSGTEAAMSAIRVARTYTERSKIVKFAGCYHGHADGLLVKAAGSGAATHGVPTSAGVPPSYAAETLVADYNDIPSVERLFEAHAVDIAGVIVEPVAGNMGVVPPAPGFLEGLRRITQQHGALLIFDEVITGFRVGYGAQALYRVTPDITCLGKIIGGGLPVGAYGGRRDVMEVVAPLGPMYQAGTLSGNPIAVAAGIACLKALQQPDVYQRLETLAARLADGLRESAQRREIPLTVNRVGSMLTAFLCPEPVTTFAEVEKADTAAYGRLFHALLAKGIYVAPSQYEAAFVSLAHSEEDIEATLEAATAALA